MTSFIRVDINAPGAGFTSQIAYLASGLTYAVTIKRSLVLTNGYFNVDYNTNEKIKLHEIIDINSVNKLLDKYNVNIVDINDLTWGIISVKYFTYDRCIDITKECERFVTSTGIQIPKTFNFNDLKGDPHVGIPKQILFKYHINGHEQSCVLDENRYEDFDIVSLSKMISTPPMKVAWCAKYNIEIFNDIIKILISNPGPYIKRLSLLFEKNINIIHIRDETDAIIFWGQINNMIPYEYAELLYKQYRDQIDKYFDIDIPVFVLTDNLQSRTLSYMKDRGYNIMMLDKSNIKGREIRAYYDLLAIFSAKVNTTLINCNTTKMTGSTFSYLIGLIVDSNKIISLDLDHIKDPVVVK